MYYNLGEEKRVKGKVVKKYAGYLGKDLYSKNNVELGDILLYITKFLDKGISQGYIDSILKKIVIEYRTWSITKNDIKLKKTLLKIK